MQNRRVPICGLYVPSSFSVRERKKFNKKLMIASEKKDKGAAKVMRVRKKRFISLAQLL